MLIALLLTPLLAAILLSFLDRKHYAAAVSAACSGLTFLFALPLIWQIYQHQSPLILDHKWFYLDNLSGFLMVLSTFIAASIALFSVTYLTNESRQRQLNRRKLRFYHSIYQFCVFCVLLAFTTNNLGVLWVSIEGATLGSVMLVGLYRTSESLEASWKYLILCGVGIAQALLGTIFLYFAAEKVIGVSGAMLFSNIHALDATLSPKLVKLAFVFIVIGYGTKVGFVPLHNWLPDAYGEAPAPASALLSGLLLNMGFYAILRFKAIADGAVGSDFSGHLLIGFGLISVVVAAFFMVRQTELRRLYAYSSIEHMGLIGIAFGIGTPLAILAGFLHMAMHALIKSATFFNIGQIIEVYRTSLIDSIRGLVRQRPGLGWSLVLCTLALLGLPPFASFTSELLILATLFQKSVVLAIILFIGLAVAFGAMLYQLQTMAFHEEDGKVERKKRKLNLKLSYLHLIIVLALGLIVPVYVMRVLS